MREMKRNTYQLEYDGPAISLTVCLGPRKRKQFDYGLASRVDAGGNYQWKGCYDAVDSFDKITQRIAELEAINVHRNMENEMGGVTVVSAFLPRGQTKLPKYGYHFPMAGITATMVMCYYPGNNGKLHIVLGKRREDSDAFPGAWCLPGGFLDAGTERVVDVARRETLEEVGVEIINERWSHFYLDDKPGTDARYVQVVNHCFSVMLTEEEYDALTPGDDITEIQLVSVDEVPELAFAHNEIVEKFLEDQEAARLLR